MTFNLLACDLREVFEASEKPIEASELAALLLLTLDESTRKEYRVALTPTREQIELLQKLWQ
jgi:hypothetical protein